MKDNRNNEEMILDEYIDKMQKEDIPVPGELEDRIQNRISTLRVSRHYGRAVTAACLAVVFIFAGGVRFNPAFAAYAASIPGLKAAVEWLQGDKGIQNAKEHGYKSAGDIVVEENGYVISLSDIIMDEDRISFSAVTAGSKISEIGDKDESIPAIPDKTSKTDTRPKGDDVHVAFRFLDFSQSGVSQSSFRNDAGMIARKVECTFKGGEVRKFMSNSPGFLRLEAKVYKGEELLYTFNTINIPIAKSNFMESKIYKQNIRSSHKNAAITVGELTVSPTRMRLDVHFDMEKGYTFTGFENPYLKDGKGNIYKPEGLISKYTNPEDRSLYFVPSLYFDKMPEELYFCYDGIRVASEEGRKFTLKLRDAYPKELEYMGQTVTIRNLSWSADNGLKVVYSIENPDVLKIQSLGLTGYHDVTGWSDHVEKDKNGNDINLFETMLYYADKQDSYDMEFEFPGYLIPENGSEKLSTLP